MTTPTFGAWLLDQAHRDDPVGDLARDLTRGDACPACSDPTRDPAYWRIADVVHDLDEHSADTSAYEALDRAAGEWRPDTGERPRFTMPPRELVDPEACENVS